MRRLSKLFCLLILFSLAGNHLKAQEGDFLKEEGKVQENKMSNDNLYLGIGMGFDHGGIVGLKFEYILPINYVSLYAGAGYNLSSVGWNVGVACKILPKKRVCPNILAFYGYNAVFKGEDLYTSQYDMTSYGVTFGANLDIKMGKRNNKLTVAFFVPIRSRAFLKNFNEVKNDPNVIITRDLIPVGLGVGFNFSLY